LAAILINLGRQVQKVCKSPMPPWRPLRRNEATDSRSVAAGGCITQVP
jgi:hypothetical protein